MTDPDSSSTSAQPHSSTVELVQKIMDRKPTLGELLCLTAVPFWFDQNLLAALRAKHDGLDDRAGFAQSFPSCRSATGVAGTALGCESCRPAVVGDLGAGGRPLAALRC